MLQTAHCDCPLPTPHSIFPLIPYFHQKKMYIYNITIKVEPHRAEEWLQWMKNIHIPQVLETGNFVESRICKIVNNEDPEDFTFVIQYTCSTLKDYEHYQKNSAPALRKEMRVIFGDDAFAFRTLMEVL